MRAFNRSTATSNVNSSTDIGPSSGWLVMPVLRQCLKRPMQHMKFCKHVQLINDPRQEEGKASSTAAPVWYKTQHQQLRATPELLLNMRTEDIANIIVKSIQNKIGVWFACNVNEDFSTKLQGMTINYSDPTFFWILTWLCPKKIE